MTKSKIQNPKSKINPNVKFQITKQRLYYFVICALLFVILTSGCATVIESAKCVVGVSTKVLEDNRKDAIKKTFNCDYNTCFSKAEEILRHIGTYTYTEDVKKKMIAVYVSEQDTTPVGIFFKEIDAHNTQIEISSPSTYAKEFIASKLFSALEKSDDK